uniref:hypothetical protein n=1 Tax=Escherichia coli TaxID=562 RepID=UPI00339877B6
MKKPNQDDEPFFITEEIVLAEMIAGGYEFELPPIDAPSRVGVTGTGWQCLATAGISAEGKRTFR